MADLFEGYTPPVKNEDDVGSLFASYATPSSKLKATQNTPTLSKEFGAVKSKVGAIVNNISAITQNPYDSIVNHDEIMQQKKNQALYDGVLSFGATIASLFTTPAKMKDAKSQAVYDAMHPSNNIKKIVNPKLQNYVQGQNDIYNKNVQQNPALMLPYMGGQVAGSLPLNPAMKGLMTLPGMAADAVTNVAGSNMLGSGLSTAAKYATGAAAGSAAGGLFGLAQYDPKNQGVLNTQAGQEMATSPYSAALGVLGTAAGSYGKQVQDFATTKQQVYGSKIFNRDVNKPFTKTLMDGVYSQMPIFGDASPRFAQRQSMIPGVQSFIKDLSEDVAKRVQNYSGAGNYDLAVQGALKSAKMRITNTENELWKPINDVANKITLKGENMQDLKAGAALLYQAHGDELQLFSPGLKKFLYNKIIDSEDAHPTFEQLKQMKSTIQSYMNSTKSISKPARQDINQFVNKMYDNLDQAIYEVSPSLVADYHKATGFTAAKYKMFDDAGASFRNAYNKTDLEQAIGDNAKAYNFANKLVTEKSPTQVNKMMAPFTDSEAQQIRAGLIAKHLKNAIDPTTKDFNIAKFLQDTSQEKNIDQVMGTSYKALQGLQAVMTPMQEAQNAALGVGRHYAAQRASQAGLYGAAAAAGYLFGGKTAAALLASAAAVAKISQYSPLKNALFYAQKASGNPKLLELVAKNVAPMIVKAGLVVKATPDGRTYIKSQDEQNSPDQQNIQE